MMRKDKNIIILKKNIDTQCYFAWIGYRILKKGIYSLKFDIFSNRNLTNFNFIKIHKPVEKYLKTESIIDNVWKYVDLQIEIFEDNDLLCFIFDLFKNNLEVKFKNISITLLE